MIGEINLSLILLAALIATGSPGPATLAIAGASMASGRAYGLAVASGVTTGSWMWSIAAALGLGAVLLANSWIFEILRYFGACYLIYLAFRSTRSALSQSALSAKPLNVTSLNAAYGKGLALHLTNPKAILFFGALFSVGIPHGSSIGSLAIVIGAIGLQSMLVFHGYAWLFSTPRVAKAYFRLRRWFEAAFALAFGVAGLKILSARVD